MSATAISTPRGLPGFGARALRNPSFLVGATLSALLLLAAARQPRATPITTPMLTATRPTTMAFCAPTSSWLAMSRPRLSVPSQWAALGGCSLEGMSISAGG